MRVTMMARPDSVRKHVSGCRRESPPSWESSMLTFCACASETRVARLSVYLKAAFTAFQGRITVASDSHESVEGRVAYGLS